MRDPLNPEPSHHSPPASPLKGLLHSPPYPIIQSAFTREIDGEFHFEKTHDKDFSFANTSFKKAITSLAYRS